MNDGVRTRSPLILRHVADTVQPVERPEHQCPPQSHPGMVTVVLENPTHGYLTSGLPLSDHLEDGGFLAGTCYRRTHDPDAFVLLVSHVVPAQHVRASATHITFTGDSFSALHEWIARQDEKLELLGWYHTHLCSPRADFGLSTIDVGMHLSIFRRPWQIAGLISHYRKERFIRFYSNTGNAMTECPAWIVAEDRWRRL